MLTFFAFAKSFLAEKLRRDDRGATAVEYGLIVVLIAVVIAVAVGTLGKDINTAFTTIAGDF